jgi:hypothetical protein
MHPVIHLDYLGRLTNQVRLRYRQDNHEVPTALEVTLKAALKAGSGCYLVI